jgi:hypothetical protein
MFRFAYTQKLNPPIRLYGQKHSQIRIQLSFSEENLHHFLTIKEVRRHQYFSLKELSPSIIFHYSLENRTQLSKIMESTIENPQLPPLSFYMPFELREIFFQKGKRHHSVSSQ